MGTRSLALLGAMLVAVVGVVAFTACGGGSGGGGGGSDERYVRDVCSAFSAFNTSTTKLLEDEELLADEGKLGEEFGKLITDLAERLSRAKPPSDVRTYHDQLVAEFKRLGDRIGSGDFSGFESGPEIPEPPQAVQDRLRAVAEKTKECEGLGLFGE